MLDKLKLLEQQYEKLAMLMGDQAVASDPAKFREHAQAYSDLEPIVKKFREYEKIARELAQAKTLVQEADDAGMREMAQEEHAGLESRALTIEQELKTLLLPKDPNDEKNILLEIRAGTGGDEATLFAQEIFRMYTRYVEKHGWKMEVLSLQTTGVGGLKEGIALVSGERVYSRLKFESGVHRVQRVPATESSGRIHTSAITVAVLPEVEDVEVQIDEAATGLIGGNF